MHWYGWLTTTFAVATLIGLLVTTLPQKLADRIPLWMVWAVPIACVPILIYALRFFWRW